MVDEDSEIEYEVRLSHGTMPSCMKMSPLDGKLVIFENQLLPDPQCSGTYYVVVTGYDKDIRC